MTRMIFALLSVLSLAVWFAARHAKYMVDRFIGLIYLLALTLQDALRQTPGVGK